MDEDTRRQRILIVDDEFVNVRVLERLLKKTSDFEFRSTTDPREVAAIFTEFAPDLILLDLHMPFLDGLAVMSQLRASIPEETFLPILVLTADATPETKLRALEAGATDFLTKPFDHAEVMLRIRNLLHTRRLHLELARHNEHLEEEVRDRTVELRQALVELQTAQDKLVQQERLSALGTMASGIAHDFNNALSIILGFGEVLLAEDEASRPQQRREYLKTMIIAAQDGARMVSRLREFHRSPDEDEFLEYININDLIDQAVGLTEPKWKGQAQKRGVTISVQVETQPISPISGNAAELREMLTNLVFNAVDAMPRDGIIILRTRNEGEHVVLEISDNGSGMTEEVRRRCLEPFFTTKGDRGTGMGLAMVYGIAQRHQATMTIESELGVGTTFRFCFPAKLPPEKESGATEVLLARPLRILLVDDEPFIREIITWYLEQDCHFVEAAANGQEALDRVRTANFDLVITDQSMPGMSGGQLAVALKKIAPERPVILLTGFGADERPQDGGNAIDLVVGKPITVDVLRNAIARVFTGQHAD